MSPIVLTPQERQALLDLRDHASKPYQRERAAALLKVADGLPAARVAREGLLRPRQPDTVYDWVKRFHAERAHVDAVVAEARASAGRVVALFQDELTYYRQPTIAYGYAERGKGQPYAERQPCKNTPTRAAATLNALDARVHYWQGSRF